MPVRVILDANFLMIPAQFQIDIFQQLTNLFNKRVEMIVLASTRNELQKIALGSHPKKKKQAELALKFVDGKCHLSKIKPKIGETADDLILRVAKKWRCPVATNDRNLRKKLRNISVPVIYLREKSHLALNGWVE
ncbi:30S processome protein Utp24 [Candidatus Bathyarchaeota archaeon]|nr:30S processome protein Utp24 [Candidatus Bathyarchaeota archaeon]